MLAKKILLTRGSAPDLENLPKLSFGEPGISTDTNLFMIGTGTSFPNIVQTTNSEIRVDYSNANGIVQKLYQAVEDSGVAAPAYQVNTNDASPSGICEPGGDGDVGLVVKGVLIARFTPTGLLLNGALTYTGQGGVIVSHGTTAQRPDPPVLGFLWNNTTIDSLEWWDGSTWRLAGSGPGGGASPWTHINHTNNDYAAQAGDKLVCNTDSAAFAIILPVDPNDLDEIQVMGDFGTRYLTIKRNGKNIARRAEDFIMTKDNSGLRLVYDANINAWRVKS